MSSLLLLFFQDLKERKVSVLLLCIAFIAFASVHFLNSNEYVFLSMAAINLLLLLVIVTILIIYTKVILKESFKNVIGAGDLFFFSIMAVGFPTVTFVFLFVASLVFSLVMFHVLKRTLKTPLIPLAGFQALFLFIIIALNSCFNFSNLYLI
jgi:hypothetical protein